MAAVFLVCSDPGIGEGLAGFDVDPSGRALREGSKAASFVDDDFEGFGVLVVPAGVVEQAAALILPQILHRLGYMVQLLGVVLARDEPADRQDRRIR
ncbi:hypothetical protein AB0K43_26220 [Kitasatospora sp. NPDC049258]|uniref:hypothetical protein n=1 Tax=Kitasatospora sp. NPDC049258 TaxID=3155394 RepID=UPI00343F8EC9